MRNEDGDKVLWDTKPHTLAPQLHELGETIDDGRQGRDPVPTPREPDVQELEDPQAGQVASYGRDGFVDVTVVSLVDDAKACHIGTKVGCYLQCAVELYVHFVRCAQRDCFEQSLLSWSAPYVAQLAASRKCRLACGLIFKEVEYASHNFRV